MMTFGDCMSLLVTFFVMLIAFSSMDKAQLANVAGVFQGAFGAVDLPTQGAFERKARTDSEVEMPEDADHAIRGEAENLHFLTQEEIAAALPNFINEIQQESDERISDRVLIQMLEEGLSVILETTDLFQEGSAEWREDWTLLWKSIAQLLLGRDNEIRIISITSSTAPVRRDIAATSWGLGVVRADAIAKELQAAMDAPPTRFGLGVQLYDDAAGTATNDHIEIMIMQQSKVTDVGSEGSWPKGMWR